MSGFQLQPVRVGSLVVEWPVFLAPMAGYTDGAFRSLCLEQGCGGVVTEMVSSQGLVRNHARTKHLLDTVEGERMVGAQLYGSDPAVMAAAAELVAATGRFAFIDINAGCPMPKIRNRGDGAGLMRNPARMAEITRQVKAAAGALPVTVKTRIGWDADCVNVLETTAGVEAAGADAICVHGRVARVRHSGPVAWDVIAEVKAARRVPVFGNGGVRVAEDVFRMVAETGVDGVMIGRPALGNPWLFRDIRDVAVGREPQVPSVEDVRAMIHEHMRREMELLGRRRAKDLRLGVDLTACLMLRAHLVRYLRGFRAFGALARTLEQRQDSATLLGRVDEVLSSGRKCER